MEWTREHDAVIARELGYNVVAMDWPCGYQPEGCGLEACSFSDHADAYPDPHPVYLPEHGTWPPVEKLDFKGTPLERRYTYAHVEPINDYLTAPTPESDYEVLRWVREHPEAHPTAQGWAGAVASELWSMWSLRAIEAGASVEPYADVPMYYQAGDYAAALYAVLQEEAKE